jgi:peptide/nickel transport system substrate-binding protein
MPKSEINRFLEEKSRRSMRKKIVQHISAVAAMTAAAAMLLAGCGGSAVGSGKAATEPSQGYAATYQGAYAMPSKTGDYSNPQPRSNIKDGGTYTYSTTYTPNWNSFSTDGNTGYMGDLWSWYMPSFIISDVKGNMKWNHDYLTSVTVKSTKPLTIAYDINPKATWNDGDPINWEDFRATWQVNNGKNPAYNPPSTEGYDQIKSVTRGKDDKEAIVTYSKPYYPWQIVISGLYNRKATDPKTFTSGWVDNPHNEWAAGPYIVQSQNKDQVTFVRNPKWWGNKGKLDRIVVKYMESAASVNAFQNGELDMMEFTSSQALKQAKSRKDAQIRYGYSKNVDVLNLNAKAGPLKDINVRRGIIQSLNFDQLTKIHYQGTDWDAPVPGSEIFAVFTEGYQDNRPKESAYSTANARKSFQAAGYKMGKDGYFQKDGKDLTVSYTFFGDTATGNALARAIQQMGKAAGIKINLDNRDGSKFSDTVSKFDYEMLPMSWGFGSQFGQITIPQIYGSKSSSNLAQVGSAEVDRLGKIPGTIENTQKAIEAGNKAEQAALKLYGTTPMDVPPLYRAVKKGLANVGPMGWKSVPAEDIGWQK